MIGRQGLRLALAALTLLASPGGGVSQTPGVKVGDVMFRRMRVATSRDSAPVQDVLVPDGVVVEVAAGGSLTSPTGALTVEGGDTLFLAPGLVDAHVHLQFAPERWMKIFLGYGVTTVFNLGGSPSTLDLRANLAEGEVAGPAIVTAGPYTNLPLVKTPGDAVASVRSQREAGYDLVKIHGDLDADVYEVLLREGREQGIPVGGHLPRNLPGSLSLDRGQTWVAHAEEWVYTLFPTMDTLGVGAWAKRAAAQGQYLIPTLATFRGIRDQWGRPEAADSALGRVESSVLPPALRTVWDKGNSYTGRPVAGRTWATEAFAFQQYLVRALFAAGGRMMIGTDTPLPVMIPGLSVHEEMREFQRLGIPESEILAAATLVPAQFLSEHAPRTPSHFGTVELGAMARFVLLRHNPYRDLSTYREPLGVLVAGRWYDAGTLGGFRGEVSPRR